MAIFHANTSSEIPSNTVKPNACASAGLLFEYLYQFIRNQRNIIRRIVRFQPLAQYQHLLFESWIPWCNYQLNVESKLAYLAFNHLRIHLIRIKMKANCQYIEVRVIVGRIMSYWNLELHPFSFEGEPIMEFRPFVDRYQLELTPNLNCPAIQTSARYVDLEFHWNF